MPGGGGVECLHVLRAAAGDDQLDAPLRLSAQLGTTARAGENPVSAARTQSQDVIAVARGSDESDTVAGNRFTDSRALLDLGLGR